MKSLFFFNFVNLSMQFRMINSSCINASYYMILKPETQLLYYTAPFGRK